MHAGMIPNSSYYTVQQKIELCTCTCKSNLASKY